MVDLIGWLKLDDVFYLLRNGLQNVIGVEFGRISYSSTNLAIQVAVAVTAFILIKLLFVRFGRGKYYRADSGHLVYAEHPRGFFAGLVMSLPKILLVIPIAFIIVAISDPFIARTKEEKVYIETRIRVDIKDMSNSMTQVFKKGGLSKAEVAMNAHLDFLKRRAGKGDRASLWVFGDLPHLIQNFIVDDEVYYLQAYDAPWWLGAPQWYDTEGLYHGGCTLDFRAPCINGEGGGTELSHVLEAVLKQFDDDENRQRNSPYFKPNAGRSVVILTDADIADFAKTLKYLVEFKKKNIVPYLIWINEQDTKDITASQKLLLEAIEANGGKYFPVVDEAGFTKAYVEIDNLEKTKIEIRNISFKIPLFQNFVFVSILSLSMIIPLGLLSQLFKDP